MAAKRVSVILGEIIEHLDRQGRRPQDWRCELLGAGEVAARAAQNVVGNQVGILFEAYSARDAHDVECELLKMGCVGTDLREDPSRNFIWIEPVTRPEDASGKSKTAAVPQRR